MIYKSTSAFPDKPFNKIALCLSGGGYRAAAFSLGTLSYLERLKYDNKPLLENVRTLSTVSGGTITGAYYACCIKEGKSFDQFYDSLYRYINDQDLITYALDILLDHTKWRGIKNRNIINAFSIAYDELLFQGKTFDVFFDGNKIHLEDIIINATEFKEGLEFRFFKSYNNKADVGNGKIKPGIRESAFREIKIADALAASSCFPSGFEPIAFPDDFIYEGTEHLNALINKDIRNETDRIDQLLARSDSEKDREELYLQKEIICDSHNPPSALMDGGIVDNQGIESVLRVEENRSKKRHYHDLLFISDVASYFVTDFQFVQRTPGWVKKMVSFNYQKLSFRQLDYVAFSALILIVLLSVYKIAFVPAIILSTILSLYIIIRVLILRLYLRAVPLYFRKYMSRFRHLSMEILGYFVKERISSVMLMVTQIFMKRIRSLHQKMIFDERWSDYWKFRACTNLIYAFKKKPKEKPDALKNLIIKDKDTREALMKITKNDSIIKVATLASQMSTTLWFCPDDKEKDQLNNLIACGQFTTCFNIIKYIDALKSADAYQSINDKTKKDVDDLLKQAIKDWNDFLDDPKFLVQKYKDQ